MRVHHHGFFSWWESMTATLMKITLPPGLHQCFRGGILCYFMRGHRHELISWEFSISWESPSWNRFRGSLVFRESHPHEIDFMIVSQSHREYSISWENTTTKISYFVSINHHENYPTWASQSKFQMHTYGPNINPEHKYNKFQYWIYASNSNPNIFHLRPSVQPLH